MYYSLLLSTYVAASGIHSYIRYRNIIKNDKDSKNEIGYLPDNSKGIVFYGYSKSVSMPVYAGNQNISFPIGGGDVSESEEKIFSKVNDKIEFKIKEETIGEIKYINNLKTLENVLTKYDIKDTDFKITLPMKTIEYTWEKGPGLLGDTISSNKSILALRYAMKKRYPLTFTVLTIGIIWAFFDFDDWQRKKKYLW